MEQIPEEANDLPAARIAVSTDDGQRAEPIVMRTASLSDGAELWRMARESGALEENSCYAYLLLCRHFSQTCLVAQRGQALVGFVTAYRLPEQSDVLFVWQIAVDAVARKQGLAKRMLQQLIALPACRGVRFLEATVAPSNAASVRLFESISQGWGVSCQRSVYFRGKDFRYQDHADEELFRIGPLGEML